MKDFKELSEEQKQVLKNMFEKFVILVKLSYPEMDNKLAEQVVIMVTDWKQLDDLTNPSKERNING